MLKELFSKHTAKIICGVLALIMAGTAAGVSALSSSNSEEVPVIPTVEKQAHSSTPPKQSTPEKINDKRKELSQQFTSLQGRRKNLKDNIDSFSLQSGSFIQKLNPAVGMWARDLQECQKKTTTYQGQDISEKIKGLKDKVKDTNDIKIQAESLNKKSEEKLNKLEKETENSKDVPEHFEQKIKNLEGGIIGFEKEWQELKGEESFKSLKDYASVVVDVLKKENNQCSFKDLIKTNDLMGQHNNRQ